MPVPAIPDHVRHMLADTYGGTVRNTAYVVGETCDVCFTPVYGYTRCRPCSAHAGQPVADRVGAAVYAVEGEQSHYMMRLYKQPHPDSDSKFVVSLLLWNALSTHEDCLNRLTGRPPRFWATVPSLPAKPAQRQHPLNMIAQAIAPGEQLQLIAQPTVAPRTLNADHYRSEHPVPGEHVLIIDDTWTTGAHAQSAALAVRAAGAEQISVLNIARYIKPSFTATKKFLASHPRRDLDPMQCCWTGGRCPD
ncbi:hypothetical protein Kisp01_06780 [Kineosporia sp. NBRC 101677]|nr:hypothetical protein Kisp01_06780 [Kineosporia sp. NBRC 101677]